MQNIIPVQEITPETQAPPSRFGRILEKAEVVIARIDALMDQNYVIQCACSFGKDSSVVLVLALEALRRRVVAGKPVSQVYVTNSNTEIESPAMDIYVEAMLSRVEAFAVQNGLPVELMQVTPSTTASFAYATLGRGKLPVFVGASRSCSIDWKLRPQQKAVKRLLSTLQNPGQLVTLVGTRFSESTTREGKMKDRGDGADTLVQSDEGFYSCAVIADWDVMDVWELLMACDKSRGGLIETFSEDFEWCLELYKEANSGTCVVLVGEGGNKAACGSRFGCAFCTVTGERDKSMEALISSAPEKHGHLEGVNKFRNFLIKTRWDMNRRDWLGRQLSKAGYLGVVPTAYSSDMRIEMLRYLLTLDVLEEERAEEHDAKLFRGEVELNEANRTLAGVTFQFITPQKLMAIDFAWSLTYGFKNAFPALREWYEIRVLGKRYPIPDIEDIEKPKVSSIRWFDTKEYPLPAKEDGLQDAFVTATNKDRNPGRPPARTVKDKVTGAQRHVVFYDEADEMEIDAAEAMLFVEDFEELYELSEELKPIDSAKYYLNQGFVKLGRGKAADYDEMARRAHYWERLQNVLVDEDVRSFVRKFTISDAEHSEILKELEAELDMEEESMDLFA
jgi:3'-phosphoadenosine 5'-phosphosulfate sulfotransferase (PAPS reductase)/FAD synthetase